MATSEQCVGLPPRRPQSNWNASATTLEAGDFNGDGRDDLAALYGYGGTTTKTWVFATAPTGAFGTPKTWWTSTTLDWKRAQVHAGDFNGDRLDDIAIWYDYADGSDKVFITPSTGSGTFGTAGVALTSPVGGWDVSQSRLVVGDYNGDGRSDLGAMYNYADGSVKTWTMTTKSDGTFNAAVAGWATNTSAWSYAHTRLFSSYN
ncbi:hypothetical protein GCM10020367_17750 [Streptomyces sannanensis]|uniref:VCBS repeat-containing protein n=1 Tax=Streptomyces sannanensis TaxID=285536 RepID=A0ABP6S853_9ACTN